MARKSSKRRSSRRLARNGDVADTILQQMGGAHRLKAMIGAYGFYGTEKAGEENGLLFKWKGRAKNGAKGVTISLDPSDTYTVKFWKVVDFREKVVGEFDMIYDDQLIPLFEAETGLYLRM